MSKYVIQSRVQTTGRDASALTDLSAQLEDVPCDLCGEKNEEFLYTKNGVLTNYPFRVVRCKSDGLIYLNPRLNKKAISNLYDEAYYQGKGFDPHVNYVTEFNQDSDAEKIFRPEETIKIVKDLIPFPGYFFDFGCGLGDVVRQAQKYGYTAEGSEASQFAADFARQHGLKVYGASEELPTEKYDIVTAIEVFEHCHSPMEALRAIYRTLKPGGVLYYTTLNFDGFYEAWRRGAKDERDGYIVPEGHIYFFSTSVMQSYFKKIGFSRSFSFEPKAYQKNSRVFKLLAKTKLINGALDTPEGLHEKILYYGARKILTLLGKRTPLLPLAIK